MTSPRITADLLDLNGNPITSTSRLVLRRTGSGNLVPAESAPHSLRRVGGITNNGSPVPAASRTHKSPSQTQTRPSSDHTNLRSVHSVNPPKAASRASPSASPHHKHANVHTSLHPNAPHPRDFHVGPTPYLYPWQTPDSPFHHPISPPDTSTPLPIPAKPTEDDPSIPLPATARVKVMSSPARRVEVAEPAEGVRERTAVLEEDERPDGDGREECDIWCEVAECI